MAGLEDQVAPEPDGFSQIMEVEEPILTMATKCESNFTKRIHILHSKREDKHEFILRKLKKRFLDWAAYLGAFAGAKGSLDERLKRHPQYRNLILLVLDMLNMNLLQTMADPSETSSESSDDEVDRGRVELDGIQKSINELDRLAIHIRQSSTSSIDARVKAFTLKKPADVSSFETKAILVVNGLYPDASESLRRRLSKSMTHRHMKLLYWRSHDRKLRTDRRRGKKSGDDFVQMRPEPSPLPTKGSPPQLSAIYQDTTPPKPEVNRMSVGTSFLSGTQASELDSQLPIPTAEAKVPSPRRAGASTVLGSGAKFPDPPQFKEGEVQKPCFLCQRLFRKADFADNVWWRCHVNEDLLPFVCIASSCLQYPTFASRSDWRAHTEGDHDGFWRRGPSNPTGNEDQSFHPNFQVSDPSLPVNICPLCCRPLDKSRPTQTSIPRPSVSPESKDAFEGAKKGTKTVRFDVLEHEGERAGDRTARGIVDSKIKAAAPIENSLMNSTTIGMMNHIADHLQFLALLTPRLSTGKLSDGDIHSFSSSQALSSDQGPGIRSTLNDEFSAVEEDGAQETDADMFLDNDLNIEEPKSVESYKKILSADHHFMVPFGRNENFVGRESILQQLLERIPPSTKKDDCQRTALEGLGGIGKTQTALEASYRVRDKHPDCSVFWVPAVDATSFENAYRDIGRQLGVKGMEDDKADVKMLVRAALSHESAGSWLLIVDNADDLKLFADATLSEYLPFNRNGSILFTTRNHEAAVRLDIPQQNIMNVTRMNNDEATNLLRAGLKEDQIRDVESITHLMGFLANLPLAIMQASAYMVKTGISTSKYLQHCQSSDKTMVKLLSQDFEDRNRYKNINNPIATTWLISFNHISRDYPLAARYLKFICYLAEKDIPISLLPPAEDELEADEAIGVLKGYAFIMERNEPDLFDVHRLVRLATRNWLQTNGEWQEWAMDAIQHLTDKYPFPKHENRAIWMRYLPHGQAVLHLRNEFANKETDLLFNVAESNSKLGKYNEAEQMYRQTLELREQVLGRENPSTLASMNNLAEVLRNQGKYEEAEQMHRQTLELRERVLGREHPDTLDSMNNLAEVLRNKGKYEEAEQMHRQTLELMERVLGKEHPSTLRSKANLDACLQAKIGKGL